MSGSANAKALHAVKHDSLQQKQCWHLVCINAVSRHCAQPFCLRSDVVPVADDAMHGIIFVLASALEDQLIQAMSINSTDCETASCSHANCAGWFRMPLLKPAY
jgi:hypothetical protein